MSVMTPEAIQAAIEQHVIIWNEHDEGRFLAHWHAIAPGGVTMEDPVGTPLKQGWGAVEDMFRLFNPVTTQRLDRCYVCGSEAAVVFHNQVQTADGTIEISDIELWRFGDDGSLLIRTWFDMPGEGALQHDFLDEYTK
jgi:hypothetical protein